MRRTARLLAFHGGIYSNWAHTPFSGKVAYAEMRDRLDQLGIEGQPEGLEITGRLRGKKYDNNEQWMMAAKAWLMNDLATLVEIHKIRDPKAIKALGRNVKPFNEALWQKACEAVVTAGAIAKFTATDRMRQEILDTGDLILVEGSPVDRIWGVGIRWSDPAIEDPKNWRGKNLLGKCLMEARSAIRSMA